MNRLGLSVNYQGVGSTTGRQFFAAGTVDFGVSEIPFQSDDPPNHRAFDYLPIVAGGTSMMYNLKTPSGNQIRNLKLSPATIALIFTGKITNWSDSRITPDYGSQLSDQPIRLLVRSDGSGTSAQFSAFIAATQPALWQSFTSACGIPDAYTSFWPYGQPNCLPNAVGQKGSDGIANYVSNPGLGVGTIGYLEAGYAVARNFPVVGVKNASGHFTIPTAVDVAIALQHAHLNPDSTQELGDVYTAPEANAYPISSYSYMIVPTDSSITHRQGRGAGQVHPLLRVHRAAGGPAPRLFADAQGARAVRVRRRGGHPRSPGSATAGRRALREPDAERHVHHRRSGPPGRHLPQRAVPGERRRQRRRRRGHGGGGAAAERRSGATGSPGRQRNTPAGGTAQAEPRAGLRRLLHDHVNAPGHPERARFPP